MNEDLKRLKTMLQKNNRLAEDLAQPENALEEAKER